MDANMFFIIFLWMALCRMQQKLDFNRIIWKNDTPFVRAGEYAGVYGFPDEGFCLSSMLPNAEISCSTMLVGVAALIPDTKHQIPLFQVP
jgi:hypothetical protein